MRGTPGAEKKRFRWIRDNVLIPFINWGRKEYDGIDVESGAPMGDEHTAVSWCDGDNSQIDTIVSEEGIQIYAANNIIATSIMQVVQERSRHVIWERYSQSPRN